MHRVSTRERAGLASIVVTAAALNGGLAFA